MRPESPSLERMKDDPRTRIASFDDEEELTAAMDGADAILSLVGITRSQFSDDANYQSVDYQTTISLVNSGKKAGVSHFVLMSSIGANLKLGAYLKYKNMAEQVVIKSGIPYTIVRPSYLFGNERKAIPGNNFSPHFRAIPGLKGIVDDWRAIPIETVVWNFAKIITSDENHNKILTGRDLWFNWSNKK